MFLTVKEKRQCFSFSWIKKHRFFCRITSLEKENKDITEEYGSVVKDLREKSEKAFDDMNRERNIMKNAVSELIEKVIWS